MSSGTIWLGQLPAWIAYFIAWHCLISFYLLPCVAPITTMSGRWQNNHSNKIHCIVFTALETCTGSFMRHNIERGGPLLWSSLAVSLLLDAWAVGIGQSSALSISIPLALASLGVCLGLQVVPEAEDSLSWLTWKQFKGQSSFLSPTSCCKSPGREHRNCLEQFSFSRCNYYIVCCFLLSYFYKTRCLQSFSPILLSAW